MKVTEYSTLKREDSGIPFPEQWVWSLDEDQEVWCNFEDTREAAIAEAIASRTEEDRFTDYVYVAPVKEYEIGLSAHSLLEQIETDAYDECGEVAEDGLGATKEQVDNLQERLNTVVSEWLTIYNLWPKWSRIGKIEKIPVTQENTFE